MGVAAVTNPWIFTVGGHFRLLPEWTGSGVVEGPGGTYRIFVSFIPSRGGSRILLIAHPGTAAGPGKEITFAETDWWFGDPCPARPRKTN